MANCPLCGVIYYSESSNGTKISVRSSGVSNVLKSMEIHSGLSELSVISQVSAVEGCPFSGVPL